MNIEILLVTHGKLATELIETAEMITGNSSVIRKLEIDVNDPPDYLLSMIENKIQSLEYNQHIIILTDLYGGSCSNLSRDIMKKWTQCRVLTGVNLPMVIESITNQEKEDIDPLVEKIISVGRNGIINLDRDLPHPRHNVQ